MKTCTKSMFLLKTTISCRFSLVFDSFFIENQCPSQAKSLFLLKALIFFFFILLRGPSPLDPGAHLPEPHVLRSSSSWLSQIYLHASGVSADGVWGWSWIAKPDILRVDMVSCRYTCIEYVLWCPFRWASQSKQLWLNGNDTGKQIAEMWKAMGMWSTIHPSWDGPKPDKNIWKKMSGHVVVLCLLVVSSNLQIMWGGGVSRFFQKNLSGLVDPLFRKNHHLRMAW